MPKKKEVEEVKVKVEEAGESLVTGALTIGENDKGAAPLATPVE